MKSFFKKFFFLILVFLIFLSFFVGVRVGKRSAPIDFGKVELTDNKNSNIVPEVKDDKKSQVDENIDFDLFWQVWNSIKKDYIGREKVTDKQLFYGSLKGMVDSLNDPYSVFLDPENAKEFYDDLQGDFEGIGAELAIRNNILTVIAPLANSPAEKAGIKSGDQIYRIDKLDAINLSLENAVTKIRGKGGTKVILTIKRNNVSELKEVAIIRSKIHIGSVEWKLIENDKEIIHLTIRQFNDDIKSEFREAIDKILSQEKRPKAIILDLRNNPGGFLDASVEIASYWLPSNTVVVKEKFDGQEKEYKTENNSVLDKIQTIILINQGSASASEILTGALQDYKKATTVGEKTFGKGCVQKVEDLSGGSMLKLTVADWLTPLGRIINDKGIDPDIKIEMTQSDYEQDKDPQLQKAIELIHNSKNTK
ncbi:MAG: S41 family peptidase [Patescibacteria group bacterium]